MSYKVGYSDLTSIFAALSKEYKIYAPKCFPKQGRFSDTDVIRYDTVQSAEEIVYAEKSDYPAKEVLTPIQQAIFYFTEDEYRESKAPSGKILIFMRPCDINAMHHQEKIYMGNGGYEDAYYRRMKEKVKIALMECGGGDDTCFCVSMGSNKTDNYDIAARFSKDGILLEVKNSEFEKYFDGAEKADFTPAFVEENELKVTVPEIPDKEVLTALKAHEMWQQFNGRCISCGACTVACSTCTCFTTRDVIYGDNAEVGERRRVTASCQIEGFDEMAGGAAFRRTAGDRMRYKVLHKFHDYKERFKDFHMCVGCGRCTSRCPEYISISATVNKMSDAVAEIRARLGK